MKSKRTKAIPAHVMRGHEGLNGWLLLTTTALGKRWTISAWTPFMSVYYLFRCYLASVRRGEIVRLVSPGGIIAAESHARTRQPKKPLKDTGRLMRSVAEPAGYPHQTTIVTRS